MQPATFASPTPSDPAILVVDDNADHLELTVMALDECCEPGMVQTASEGLEALDFLFGQGSWTGRDTSVQPRLVILDLKMVRMHGLEVLQAIRADERTRALPVVIHSSSVEKEDVARSYARGASGYLRKATNFDEMRVRMRALHDFWLYNRVATPPWSDSTRPG
jgi:CheY-like chemotaxis protein